MKKDSIVCAAIAFCLLVVMSAGSRAQNKVSKKLKDEAGQSGKAARVFREIMNIPHQAIPTNVLDRAECVAVFPSVIKAGFIIGGRSGRGVASCRTLKGWSGPVYLNLGGGSVGLQIGAQATDFVMLFMKKDGVDSLLSSKFKVGGDASVAAGPVGRESESSTDLGIDAQIYSYSRSRGLFAGIELKGVEIEPDDKDMSDVYGEGVTAKEVLLDNKVTAPAAVRSLPNTLGRYSSRKAK